ncbi:(2Fe-2S)-binding protein [Microbaculum marinum]|uniref:(2Fe-2S)-binding protein n=1 Tax=Microbaculum marinum TaxID=1764581 RepID=A0AAW9RM33_9HYPH
MRFIDGIRPAGASVRFTFEGRQMTGFEGESIASALMRAGVQDLRVTARLQEARGYYCGMGICWECAVRVEGHGVVRSCAFPLSEGIAIELADGEGR